MLLLIYGDYVVNAEYSEHVASTNFTLVEKIVDVEDSVSSNIMTLTLDDFEYLKDEYMTISGTLPNFDSDNDIYYQVVHFNFYTSDGKPVTFEGRFDENDNSELHSVTFTATAIPDSPW